MIFYKKSEHLVEYYKNEASKVEPSKLDIELIYDDKSVHKITSIDEIIERMFM